VPVRLRKKPDLGAAGAGLLCLGCPEGVRTKPATGLRMASPRCRFRPDPLRTPTRERSQLLPMLSSNDVQNRLGRGLRISTPPTGLQSRSAASSGRRFPPNEYPFRHEKIRADHAVLAGFPHLASDFRVGADVCLTISGDDQAGRFLWFSVWSQYLLRLF